MKPLHYLSFLSVLLFFSSCKEKAPFNEELSGAYDSTNELFISALVPREPGFLYRVSLVNGARKKILASESPGTLELPLGTTKLFDPASNRSVTYRVNGPDLISQQFSNNNGVAITDFIPISTQDFSLSFSQPQEMLFGNTVEMAWLSYRNGSTLLEADLEQGNISLLTDSLATGSIGLHRFLLDLTADNLYFFGEDRAFNPIWADTLLTFNSNTFELKDSKSLAPVFAIIQDPASGRIFGLTAPNQDRGFRLVEISPMATNPIRIISLEDLPIDQVSTNLRAIHTATNSLVITTGNNSIEGATNFLRRIDLNTGELSATTEVLPGTIITGIFAE